MTGEHKATALYAISVATKAVRARLAEAEKLPTSTNRERGESTRRQRLERGRLAALKAARVGISVDEAPAKNAKTRAILEDLVQFYAAAERAPAIRRQAALESLAQVVLKARAHLREEW